MHTGRVSCEQKFLAASDLLKKKTDLWPHYCQQCNREDNRIHVTWGSHDRFRPCPRASSLSSPSYGGRVFYGGRRTAGPRLWGLGFRNRNIILFRHETVDFVHEKRSTDNCPHFRDGSTLPRVYTSSIVVYYRLWSCMWGPKSINRYLTGPMTVRRVDIFTTGRRTAGRRWDGGFRRGPRSLRAPQ